MLDKIVRKPAVVQVAHRPIRRSARDGFAGWPAAKVKDDSGTGGPARRRVCSSSALVTMSPPSGSQSHIANETRGFLFLIKKNPRLGPCYLKSLISTPVATASMRNPLRILALFPWSLTMDFSFLATLPVMAVIVNRLKAVIPNKR